MKSIMMTLAMALVLLVSCKKGLNITILIDANGNQYENVMWGNASYPYYGTYRPNGVTRFVGYVKGGTFGNSSEIPIFNNIGQPMYWNAYGQPNVVTASGNWISGPNGVNFFSWLQNQPTGKLIFVVIERYDSGITYTENFRIVYVGW